MLPTKLNEIQVNECVVSCPTCKTPIQETDPRARGMRVNRVASIGSEIVHLRENRTRNKKSAVWVNTQLADLFAELAALGATLDDQGFVILEK